MKCARFLILWSAICFGAPLAHAFDQANPIILLHGVAGFEKIGPLSYFGHTAEELRAAGYKVYVLQTSPFSGVSARVTQNFGYNGGKSLEDAVADIVEQNGGHKAVLIGHSMGGLDARFLASPGGADRTDLVDSVITIGTPNRGSSLADVGLSALPERLQKGVQSALRSTSLASKDDADLGAFKDLTRSSAKNFNETVPNNPKVEYFSVAGTMSPGNVPPELKIPQRVIASFEGPNDGMVSEQSAEWGHYLGSWDTDHWGESGCGLLPSRVCRPFPSEKKIHEVLDRAMKISQDGTYHDTASTITPPPGTLNRAVAPGRCLRMFLNALSVH